MTCTNPRTMIINGEEITVNCGKCISCKRKRASDWSIKLINEAKYYTEASFITLTFDNKELMPGSRGYKLGARGNFIWGGIEASKEYFKKFMKRLRKAYPNKKIKFFHIGEYGDRYHRPHHHCIIFGLNFSDDRVKAELSKSGKEQYYSEKLENIWGAGRTRIQDVNNKNIMYISQYAIKKIKAKDTAESFYKNYYKKELKSVDKETGEIKTGFKWIYKYKPCMSFSNRSKMNCKWIRKRPEQIKKGYLTDTDGKKYGIPRSYKECLKTADVRLLNWYYIQYEEKTQEYILNMNVKFEKMIAKNKEKIFESMQKKNQVYREDFIYN